MFRAFGFFRELDDGRRRAALRHGRNRRCRRRRRRLLLRQHDVEVVVKDVGRADVADDVGTGFVIFFRLRCVPLNRPALDVPVVEALLIRMLFPAWRK